MKEAIPCRYNGLHGSPMCPKIGAHEGGVHPRAPPIDLQTASTRRSPAQLPEVE